MILPSKPLRFGKHPPKLDYRTFRLANYVTQSPPPPPSWDALDQVAVKLKMPDLSKLFPMDGNDRLGDCTIAAAAHAITVYRGLIGHKTVPSEASVVKLYNHLSGGIDSGLNMLDVLNYWRKTSFDREKILGFAQVNTKKIDQVKQAIHLFGGSYLGFQVPDNCFPEFDAGKPWTPGKLSINGHCVYAYQYDDTGVSVFTWGGQQKATWDWWLECVDEAYAILPAEARIPGFAPGFDLAALQADLGMVSA